MTSEDLEARVSALEEQVRELAGRVRTVEQDAAARVLAGGADRDVTEIRSEIRIWAFVMVLALSRLMFVRPVLAMDQRAWTEAHVEAFAFFGGVPKRLVPDNLRTGVARPDLYDPKINRAYAELANHYGALVDPARRGKPKDKPRVERPMPYVRDSFWRGREWTSVQQMQQAALVWCRDVAGQRRCRPLEGAAPMAVFDAVERETLMPCRTRTS